MYCKTTLEKQRLQCLIQLWFLFLDWKAISWEFVSRFLGIWSLSAGIGEVNISLLFLFIDSLIIEIFLQFSLWLLCRAKDLILVKPKAHDEHLNLSVCSFLWILSDAFFPNLIPHSLHSATATQGISWEVGLFLIFFFFIPQLGFLILCLLNDSLRVKFVEHLVHCWTLSSTDAAAEAELVDEVDVKEIEDELLFGDSKGLACFSWFFNDQIIFLATLRQRERVRLPCAGPPLHP